MELTQLFIVDLGWVFFAAWAAVLTLVAAIVFGPDIVAAANRDTRQKKRF